MYSSRTILVGDNKKIQSYLHICISAPWRKVVKITHQKHKQNTNVTTTKARQLARYFCKNWILALGKLCIYPDRSQPCPRKPPLLVRVGGWISQARVDRVCYWSKREFGESLAITLEYWWCYLLWSPYTIIGIHHSMLWWLKFYNLLFLFGSWFAGSLILIKG